MKRMYIKNIILKVQAFDIPVLTVDSTKELCLKSTVTYFWSFVGYVTNSNSDIKMLLLVTILIACEKKKIICIQKKENEK